MDVAAYLRVNRSAISNVMRRYKTSTTKVMEKVRYKQKLLSKGIRLF